MINSPPIPHPNGNYCVAIEIESVSKRFRRNCDCSNAFSRVCWFFLLSRFQAIMRKFPKIIGINPISMKNLIVSYVYSQNTHHDTNHVYPVHFYRTHLDLQPDTQPRKWKPQKSIQHKLRQLEQRNKYMYHNESNSKATCVSSCNPFFRYRPIPWFLVQLKKRY